MPDAKEKRIDLILQQLQQLPTLPTVALKVLELTRRDESSAQEVVKLISSDPSLTAKILRIAHRADSGLRAEAATVERAVVLLGFEMVRSAVLALSIFDTFAEQKERPVTRFNRNEFWKHSLAVASCAELLAEQIAGGADAIDSSEAFVCGLLHDLGKIALDTILPKSFDRIVEAADLLHGNIADLERSIIGIDHMIVGKRLAEQWQLPAIIRESLWLHGQEPGALPPSIAHGRMVNLVTLADLIVREQHLGYSGNYEIRAFRPALLQSIGLTGPIVRKAQEQLLSRIEDRAKLLGLDRTSTGELYLSALTQANAELGRVSEQLAAKSRRLAVRAKFFDALSQFQGELRPDAGTDLVLQAIGQTAASVIGLSPIAVFSTQPMHGFAEISIVEEHGDVLATSVADAPPSLPRIAAGEGPVLPAGSELEWLMADVSPRLGGEQRYWIRLEAEGVCIGGVLWGSKTGEAQRLASQASELTALAAGWGLALRMAQIREESRALAEQLADANRQLQSVNAELVRSRTLASVGEMAAGAAHEMNNPLAVISGRSQLLATQVSDSKLKRAAETIAEQAHRLSEIITDLMEFARPVPPKPQETDLADLLDRALYDARNALDPGSRRIEITMGELPPVVVDRQQVQAAFVQVLHNALQATDERNGQIHVHAAYDTFTARVVVTVIDNGRGMDEQTLKHAFDPFFSSHPAGRRRGLGLAKALRWVESSGGTIRLESKPDQGTRAMVLLPAAWPTPAEKDADRREAAGG